VGIASFGAIFSKMSDTGVTFFFLDCLRRWCSSLCCLSSARTDEQRSCADGHELGAGARQFREILFTLPYEKFGSNVRELGIAVSASEVASTTTSP
jgi:hypothetical protein